MPAMQRCSRPQNITRGNSGVMAILVRKLLVLTVWKKIIVIGTEMSQALSATMMLPRTACSKELQRISHEVRRERGI